MGVKVKKILIGIITLAIMFSLTGCDIDDYIDGFTADLKDRISMNQQEVDKLKSAGLLSDESAQSLKEAIAAQEAKISGMSKGDISKVAYRVEGLSGVDNKNTSRKESITIISEDNKAMQELMDNLDFKVYVLKKDPLGTGKGENSLATLDLISTEVEKAKNGNPSNIDNYFVDSGRKVWDTSKPENKILKITNTNSAYNNWETSNVMGKDYVGTKIEVEDDGTEKRISRIQIPIQEFNKEAIERLVGKDGVNKDTYVIVGTKCYLMQYPVYYVDKFTASSGEYKANYSKSELQINILTKKIMDSEGRECVAPVGDILKVSGTGGYSELGEASFVIDGLKGEPTNFGYDPNQPADGSAYTPANAESFGRVVLRDYLELNYMPTVVEGENLVALGRRLRLTKFKGNGEEEIGLFIDKSGNAIENSVKIKSTDLMSIDSGTDGKRYKLNIEASSTPAPTASPDPAEVDTSNTFQIGQSQDSLLEDEFKDEIEVSTIFPGSLVATTDNKKLGAIQPEGSTSTPAPAAVSDEQAKHIMYGIAVDIDPFQSNLFSGWIDITGENGDIGSLDWWNNWLSASTYRYHIDRDRLLGFLTGSYTYEMRDNNIILIDIPTVTQIQEEFNRESKVAAVRGISTMFVVLGIVLMAYAVLTVTAWVYDTNIIAGPRLLGLISFNRWEAVSSSDEMPYIDRENKHYMTLGKILQSAIVIVGIGALLIFVDIVSIVDALILTLGHFAQVLSDILLGVK